MRHLLTTLLLAPALAFGQYTESQTLEFEKNEIVYSTAVYDLCQQLNNDQLNYKQFHREYISAYKRYIERKKFIEQFPADLYITTREKEE